MPLLRLLNTFVIFATLPLQVLLLPLSIALVYPLGTWCGHRILRTAARSLMLMAAIGWARSSWAIYSLHVPFRWSMAWVPLVPLLVGAWLRELQARSLAAWLRWDVSIDPMA